MAELYEAREIREGDWVLDHGVPHVFYDMKLMTTGELVLYFQEIIAEWMDAHRTDVKEVRGMASLRKALDFCRAEKQELRETLEETLGELDTVKKERGDVVTQRQRDMMRHALGLSLGCAESHRNYYTAPRGCDGFDELVKLEDMGMMTSERSSVSEDFIFHVTDKGKAAL